MSDTKENLFQLFKDAQIAIYGREMTAQDLIEMKYAERQVAQHKADRLLEASTPLALGIIVMAIQSPDERTRVKAAFGVLEKSPLYTKIDKRKKPEDPEGKEADKLGISLDNPMD